MTYHLNFPFNLHLEWTERKQFAGKAFAPLGFYNCQNLGPNGPMKNGLSVGNGHTLQTEQETVMLKGSEDVVSVCKWGIRHVKGPMENDT